MPRLATGTKLERRQRLIDAAWRCLADRAFASLTVDDVCEEAGVSKGAFYVYFEQKQDLLLALLEDETASMDGVIEDLRRADLNGVARLRRFARAMFERGSDPARLQIRADLWGELSSTPIVRERWVAVVRGRREVLRRWIDESLDAGELTELPANALAAILLALGEGLLLHAGLDPSGFRWPNVEKAMDAILEGLSS